MCGICGIYNIRSNTKASRISNKIILDMTRCLAHRGPEDQGTYTDNRIALGHRRLKIIDLSKKGHQPMSDSEKDIFITFNGEIYNFQEIKDQLIKKGHHFNSKSDTEVIIYAYKEWGIDCIKRFNGMFAFALYDKRYDKLFLVRDRLGIKPLSYTILNNKILFSSEIKSILKYPGFNKEINWKAISSYLSYRYVLGEDTFFKNIYSVEPGHYLEIKKGNIRKVEYWDIPLPQKKDLGKKYYIKKIRELLTESVKLRMISDVPLGAYLSGGLDSSIVVSIMSRLTKEHVKTYSIAFKQKEFNELKYAKMIADRYKTDHKEIVIDAERYLNAMKNLIRCKDAPLAVPNEIPIFFLSKDLKKDITVVLSGEGSDEIFSGYGRLFRSPFDYQRLKLIPKTIRKRFFRSLNRKYKGKDFSSEMEHFLFQYDYFQEKNTIYNDHMKKISRNDKELVRIFDRYFRKASDLDYYDKISYVFEKLHLLGLLEKLDNPTMATAVEGRVPFVDHNLVEFMFTVPHKYKLKWKSKKARIKAFFKNTDEISENLDITKYILKEAFKKDIPKEIIRRKKKGFPVPLDTWFKGKFVDYAKRMILSEDSKTKAIFDQDKLKAWIDNNLKNKDDKEFGKKLWMILNIELWLREYF